jgi:hypothetical protein
MDRDSDANILGNASIFLNCCPGGSLPGAISQGDALCNSLRTSVVTVLISVTGCYTHIEPQLPSSF